MRRFFMAATGKKHREQNEVNKETFGKTAGQKYGLLQSEAMKPHQEVVVNGNSVTEDSNVGGKLPVDENRLPVNGCLEEAPELVTVLGKVDSNRDAKSGIDNKQDTSLVNGVLSETHDNGDRTNCSETSGTAADTTAALIGKIDKILEDDLPPPTLPINEGLDTLSNDNACNANTNINTAMETDSIAENDDRCDSIFQEKTPDSTVSAGRSTRSRSGTPNPTISTNSTASRSRSGTPNPVPSVTSSRSRSSTPVANEIKPQCGSIETEKKSLDVCNDSSNGSKMSEMCSDENKTMPDISETSSHCSEQLKFPEDSIEMPRLESNVNLHDINRDVQTNEEIPDDVCVNRNLLRVKTSEDRSIDSSVSARSSVERTIESGFERSSEERSLDSLESAKSKTSQSSSKSSVPRARKSMNKPSNISHSTDLKSLAPIANVTIKLPDFDNPIQIDSRTLEKINRLGKMESKCRLSSSGKSDKHFNKKNSPVKKISPTLHSTTSPLKPKLIHKRRKYRRMGTYKLPNELRKGKFMKKKGEREISSERSASDQNESDNSCRGDEKKTMKMEVDSDSADAVVNASNSQLNSKPDILSAEGLCSGSDESDSELNSSHDPSVNTSSAVQSDNGPARKNIWDIFRLTPKTKTSLGSTRVSKASLCAKKIEKANKNFKGKTMEDYLKGSVHQKSSHGADEDLKSTTDDSNTLANGKSHLLEEAHGIRKRKIAAAAEEEEEKAMTDVAVPLPEEQHSGKKQRLEDGRRNLIAVFSGPQMSTASSPGMRSLLPKNLTSNFPHTQLTTVTTSTLPQMSESVTGTSQMIVLSSPGVSVNGVQTSITQPFFNSHLGLMAKPHCKTNDSLTAANPLCVKKMADSSKPSVQQLRAPVLNRLLTQKVSDQLAESEKENSSDSLPSSLSYPVTPPKTPDDQRSEDSCSAPPGPTPPDKDIIPLCCCKINGANFKKLGSTVTYCQSLDSVDGKVMGCCNKVTGSHLVRPGVKIPFMALCEAHRKRLRLHQCCPGCGHFCTQGKFYQCRKEGAVSVHYFHKQCQVLKGGKYYCPHCGESSSQFEVTLSLEDPVCETAQEEKVGRTSGPARAKMSIHANSYRSFLKPEKDPSEDMVTASCKTSNDKILSTGGIPIGPDKKALEKVIANLSEERPKKYRSLPKCIYNPAYEGDLDKIVFMLVDGYNPDEMYEEFDNQTALHAAAIGGSLPIVHLLVQAGASIHSVDKELKTPLIHAAENNHVNILRYLIKAGAEIKHRGEDGMTVLHHAAKAGHLDAIKVLLDCDDVDVNVQDDGGWTPIIWASENKLVNVVRILVKHGADPHLKDKEENTSLHWAAFSGSVDIAETFLNAGCDLETPNEHGDRPLHIASRQDHYECVVLFLARGADVEAKNNESEFPIQCCPDENSQVWLALKVNKQLKGFAANRLARTERLVHRDVSMGRENIPIAVVNGVDDDPLSDDFQYITENTETTDLNINRTISSLQSCRCQDACSSMFCVCGRNSVKCWYDRGCRLLPDFNMFEPPLIFECNKGCRCWSTCNNRVVQNGIVSRLQMFKTEGRGWGVKSLVDVPKGMFMCEYIGELISDSEADGREDDSYLFDLDNRDGDTYCIDARKYGNISRFINHLCEPNLIPVKVYVDHQDLRFPRICFFSSREIRAHEELGFDYGEKFWMIKWKQFTCACGSEKCKYSNDTIQKTLQDYQRRHEDEGLLE